MLPLEMKFCDLYVDAGNDLVAVGIFVDKEDKVFEVEFLLNKYSSVVNRVFSNSKSVKIPSRIKKAAQYLLDDYRNAPTYDEAKEAAIREALGQPKYQL